MKTSGKKQKQSVKYSRRRRRKNGKRKKQKSLDSKINKAEDKAIRLKKEYEEAVEELKKLRNEKRKIQAEILLQAIDKSDKSFEEILKIITL